MGLRRVRTPLSIWSRALVEVTSMEVTSAHHPQQHWLTPRSSAQSRRHPLHRTRGKTVAWGGSETSRRT